MTKEEFDEYVKKEKVRQSKMTPEELQAIKDDETCLGAVPNEEQ